MCDYDYHLEIKFDIFYHVYAHHHHVKKPQAQKIENLNQEKQESN
jgi:hypothetical protein